MELIEPKPKKYCKLRESASLPLTFKKDQTLYKFSGTYNGFSVLIDDEDDMKKLISMGFFGKANFSRSYPQFIQNKPEILRARQVDTRKTWSDKFINKNAPQKVIVVPDSDSETEDYFINLKPEYTIVKSGINESVHLSLEEAFFLVNAIKCLNVTFNGTILSPHDLWKLFSESERNFVRNYIVYYHCRVRNWVVKPGIKFGGDYLLYKQGPAFYHASYVVVINALNENMELHNNFSHRCLKNTTLLGLNRLCETAGKELFICKIIMPSNLNEIDFNNFANITVDQTLMRRWIPNQGRVSEEYK